MAQLMVCFGVRWPGLTAGRKRGGRTDVDGVQLYKMFDKAGEDGGDGESLESGGGDVKK
jgi:hypothetical protein